MPITDFGNIVKNKAQRSTYQIIDVREPHELALSCISGEDVLNLPLSTSDTWAPQIIMGKILDANKPTLCLCHHGRRSMQMAEFLVGKYVWGYIGSFYSVFVLVRADV